MNACLTTSSQVLLVAEWFLAGCLFVCCWCWCWWWWWWWWFLMLCLCYSHWVVAPALLDVLTVFWVCADSRAVSSWRESLWLVERTAHTPQKWDCKLSCLKCLKLPLTPHPLPITPHPLPFTHYPSPSPLTLYHPSPLTLHPCSKLKLDVH